jgi:hypothetical protein
MKHRGILATVLLGFFCIFATIPFWELCGLWVGHGTRPRSPVRRKAGGGLRCDTTRQLATTRDEAEPPSATDTR